MNSIGQFLMTFNIPFQTQRISILTMTNMWSDVRIVTGKSVEEKVSSLLDIYVSNTRKMAIYVL